ncbi:hypothetical protein [Bacillus sp. FJAT-18017]|nr:hypothetical protein [Bacillus sp. FJAT-18017]
MKQRLLKAVQFTDHYLKIDFKRDDYDLFVIDGVRVDAEGKPEIPSK